MKKLLLGFAMLTAAFSGVQAVEEVNVYSHRHYDTDKKLFKLFTEKTGIKINVVKAKADQLIARIEREGKNSPADLLVTVDAGRLVRAKDKGLFQDLSSKTIEKVVPANLRDNENKWTGLTIRSRVIVYQEGKTDPKTLTTYEDLAKPEYKGKVVIRSSSNMYNQSLLASIIANKGETYAAEWAKGMVANMARNPKGNDRAQVKAVVAGVGELAVVNTYYIGKMLNSKDAKEVEVGKKVKVFFPNQNDRGAHINVSGAGILKHSKNKANAVKLLEFLVSEEAQTLYSEANYEYPVNKSVEPSALLKSWGAFKSDKLNLQKLGELNSKAVEIFDRAGWK